jgi:hypothetical protein
LLDYIRDHILTPLGMRHTSFPTGNEFPQPHAQGYTNWTGRQREDEVECLLSLVVVVIGGVSDVGEDVVKFSVDWSTRSSGSRITRPRSDWLAGKVDYLLGRTHRNLVDHVCYHAGAIQRFPWPSNVQVRTEDRFDRRATTTNDGDQPSCLPANTIGVR